MYKIDGGASEDVYESEIQYKLQGKTVGKSSVRRNLYVLSALLRHCHRSVKLYVGKKSNKEAKAL